MSLPFSYSDSTVETSACVFQLDETVPEALACSEDTWGWHWGDNEHGIGIADAAVSEQPSQPKWCEITASTHSRHNNMGSGSWPKHQCVKWRNWVQRGRGRGEGLTNIDRLDLFLASHLGQYAYYGSIDLTVYF